MPPTLVRNRTRVRVSAINVIATSFLLALIAFSSLNAGARRLQKGTIINSGTRLWVSATLPQGKVGVAYVGAVGVRGGIAPYTFTSVGSLPAGIVLNAGRRQRSSVTDECHGCVRCNSAVLRYSQRFQQYQCYVVNQCRLDLQHRCTDRANS
jgi:hypothetical protein